MFGGDSTSTWNNPVIPTVPAQMNVVGEATVASVQINVPSTWREARERELYIVRVVPSGTVRAHDDDLSADPPHHNGSAEEETEVIREYSVTSSVNNFVVFMHDVDNRSQGFDVNSGVTGGYQSLIGSKELGFLLSSTT